MAFGSTASTQHVIVIATLNSQLEYSIPIYRSICLSQTDTERKALIYHLAVFSLSDVNVAMLTIKNIVQLEIKMKNGATSSPLDCQ